MAELTKGVIPLLFNKQHTAEKGPVTLQVVMTREISNRTGSTRRVRAKLHDSVYENQMAVIVTESKLEKGDIIKLTEWIITGVNDKHLMQIENFEVVKSGAEMKNENIKIWKLGDAFEKIGAKKNSGGKENRPVRSTTAPEGGRYMAIQTLTPYMNKWTIKARVTSKTPIKEWTNARGSGKLFSFLIDDSSCDMKISAFNEEAEKFFNIVEKGKVIVISNGQLKAKNIQWNRTAHDYECTLTRQTVLEEAEDDGEIPEIRFEFEPIAKIISDRSKGAFVDVIGVVDHVDNLDNIRTRAGNDLEKRDVQLVDSSCEAKIRVTFWGEQAKEFTATRGQVLAIKGCSVGEFQGKSLSVGRDSAFVIDLADERGNELKAWWQQDGQDKEFVAQASSMGGGRGNDQLVTLGSLVNGENYTQPDKPFYFSSKCYLAFIQKTRLLYKGCPGKDGNNCNKKLIDDDAGTYRCEKCDWVTPDYKWRLMMSAACADESGSQFVQFFGETGEQVLDITAQELGPMQDSVDNSFDLALDKNICKEFILGGRAKQEVYQDEEKLRIMANRIAEVNYDKYGMSLVEQIEASK